jgi:diadenosine tetraphosphate (Ap4A) HIT family hydrolase
MAVDCELCQGHGGLPVWSDAEWRVVRVEDAAFPAFYRVIAQPHLAEFTDLDRPGRERCMALVAGIEQVLRDRLRPTKVNLASLGNVVAHLHWHVIARFEWDSHFPQPVWCAAQREVAEDRQREMLASLPALDVAVGSALASGSAERPG